MTWAVIFLRHVQGEPSILPKTFPCHLTPGFSLVLWHLHLSEAINDLVLSTPATAVSCACITLNLEQVSTHVLGINAATQSVDISCGAEKSSDPNATRTFIANKSECVASKRVKWPRCPFLFDRLICGG